MGRFNFNEADFEEIARKAEDFYNAIGEIRCPYFGEKIAFNTAGLKHLKFKSDKVARPHSEQYARLKLLPLAPQVLSLSRTVQGISYTKHFERIRIHINEGQKFFWSIIPYWKIDLVNSRRVLHSGDPESD